MDERAIGAPSVSTRWRAVQSALNLGQGPAEPTWVPGGTSGRGYFGVYNGLYFLRGEAGRIVSILDRVRGKASVRFEENELDFSKPPTEEQEENSALYLEGELPYLESNREYTIDNRTFKVTGPGAILIGGSHRRGLIYRPIELRPDVTAVVLTVNVPSSCRYRITLDAASRSGHSFALGEGIVVTVLSDYQWRYEANEIVFETQEEERDLAFLVESEIPFGQVSDIAIIAAKGSEREAVLARAAFGAGFVSCFVLPSPSEQSSILGTVTRDSVRRILAVGVSRAELADLPEIEISEAPNLRSSVQVSQLLGKSPFERTLLLPDVPAAFGPGLQIAVANNANLGLDSSESQLLTLLEDDGSVCASWALPEVLDVFLPPEADGSSQARVHKREVAYCENTLANLLVCQAVGYSSLRRVPVAFIRSSDAAEYFRGTESAEEARSTLERACEVMVPRTLRNPDADTVTVFTNQLPLHLTPTGNTDGHFQMRWLDAYFVAHLPGQITSTLVPRFFGSRDSEIPAVRYTLVFDALSTRIQTEGDNYRAAALRSLSHPITLSGGSARKDVLREVVHRFASSLLLIVAHGAGTTIEDGASQAISAAEISTWHLRAHPVVFNNSCSSWHTTGPSFVRAGASGVIATLWPIENAVAVRVAAEILRDLRHSGRPASVRFLKEALSRMPDSLRQSGAAYIYVGLPQTNLVIHDPLDVHEMISLLKASTESVYRSLLELGAEGRPDLAVEIHRAAAMSLRARFKELVVPGEVPLPISGWACTTLDIDYALSRFDFEFARSVLSSLPHEWQGGALDQMQANLWEALEALADWDERHDKHFGRTAAQRAEWSEQMAFHVGALGEAGFIRMGAQFALGQILPFVCILADNRRDDEAREWFSIAAKLVTTPADVASDGSVSDESLRQRIRDGIPQSHRRVALGASQGGSREEVIEIDILGSAVPKSELANYFGIARKRLREANRAVAFFQLAVELAKPGTEQSAAAQSNLGNAMREAGMAQGDMRGLLEARATQVQLGDLTNACTTTANLMRAAAQAHVPIEEGLVAEALRWTAHFDSERNRATHTSDLLGASSSYYASRGDHKAARQAVDKIADFLEAPYPFPQIAVHLNELLQWYLEQDDFGRAANLGLRNGEKLAGC